MKKNLIYIVIFIGSCFTMCTSSHKEWNYSKNPYYQPDFRQRQANAENNVHKCISYSLNSSNTRRSNHIDIYNQFGNLDSSIVTNCSSYPTTNCHISRWEAYIYDDQNRPLDTLYYPKRIESLSNNSLFTRVKYGDTLTIAFETSGIERSRMVTKYDPISKIYSHYFLHSETGLISFRNISRYNDEGLIFYTTIHSNGEESYTINYIYNDQRQLVMRKKTNAKREDETITTYEYYKNGLLKHRESEKGGIWKFEYEYY